jgi:hypothetical protein
MYKRVVLAATADADDRTQMEEKRKCEVASQMTLNTLQ